MSKYLTSWLGSPSPPQTLAKAHTLFANLPPKQDSLRAARTAAYRQEQVRQYTARQQQIHGPKGNITSHFSMDSAPNKDYGPGGKPVAWTRIFIRFLQFVLAITVAGLYGADLAAAHKAHASANASWVYAVTVAGMSAVTVMVYVAPVVKSATFWFWDLILFILWVAVFGRFATLYLHYAPPTKNGKVVSEPGPNPKTMHNAVWVDLTNVLLWFITGTYGAVVFCTRRKRTLHTGAAKV